MNFDLYYAAQKADNEFQTECERQFGKNAGNARYNKALHDAQTIAASIRYGEAINAWCAEMKRHRENKAD